MSSGEAVSDSSPDRGEPLGSSPFDQLMAQVMATADRFGHREHVHLTWLAVRRFGIAEAIRVVSAGIRTTARYAGNPQKYHETVSRAWVELVGFHQAEQPTASFDDFLAGNAALLDKRLLTRFYHPATLARAEARVGWVEPDRSPFPWGGRGVDLHVVAGDAGVPAPQAGRTGSW